MSRIDHKLVEESLKKAKRARSARNKGIILEDLICYVFSKVPGITVTRRNKLDGFKSEEIDIAFWNDKKADGLYFLPDIIIVECKNWSKPVSSEQVSWFDTKMRNRGLVFGILIATNGISGDPQSITSAHHVVSAALKEGRRMIVLKSEELSNLRHTNQLVLIMKEKICDLAVSGTVLT